MAYRFIAIMPIISADNLEYRMKVDNVQSISLVDRNGIEKAVDSDSKLFDSICDIFNHKRIRIDTKTPYLYDTTSFIIRINTSDKKYELHAANVEEVYNKNESAVLILYDYYTPTSGRYLAQYVTISADEFEKIFE
ncbi:MAG: hypothetical protein IJ872_05205 [Eubacterium sp.]|nr:hypothetical protein [Eubacterium sp.]